MTPRSKISDIRQALDELTFVEDELEASKLSLTQAHGTIHDLDKDNRRLNEENEKLRQERDKYQAYAVNLTTRLQVIAENVDSVIREASRSAISEAARLKENRAQARRIEGGATTLHPVRKAAQEAAQGRSAALLPEVEETDNQGDDRPLFLRNGRTTPPTNEFR